jgi:hypothetical protein
LAASGSTSSSRRSARKPTHGRYLTRVATLSAKEGSAKRSGTAQLELPQEGKPDMAADPAAAGKEGIHSTNDC